MILIVHLCTLSYIFLKLLNEESYGLVINIIAFMARGGRSGGGRGGRGIGGGRGHGIGSHGHGRGIGHRGHGIGSHSHFGHGIHNRRGFGMGRNHGFHHNRHHYHGLGYRHYGFGSHHRFHNHYHGFYGAGFGGGGGRRSYATTYDTIAVRPMPPRIDNGTYFFAGNQASAVANLNNFPNFYTDECTKNQGMQVPLNQASFFIVGSKTSEGNIGCFIATILTCCLIFPLLFMCCDWWKKIVYSMYEVNTETYRAVVNFLSNAPNVTKITLEVVDNAFNQERADILHSGLQVRPLTQFTFINTAQALDYRDNQYDNFSMNVFPIKELTFTTRLIWDELVM